MFLKNNNLSKKLILEILDFYQQQNPSEKITRYLPILKKSDQSIISRKNFSGHITVSAFVIDPTLSKLLLVYHINLKKYLQPGGHVKNNDKSLWLAALRELEEETGIKDVFLLPKDESNPEIPLDIDIHRIPKNPQKNEPSHLHFDFGYLFLANKDNEWKINKKEITSLTWKNIDELEKENIPDKFRLIKKIKKLILKRRDFIFFNEIIKKFSMKEIGSILFD
jgi:8-oxo-dGTP pyrophosphatase MutT (NUDIX family)